VAEAVNKVAVSGDSRICLIGDNAVLKHEAVTLSTTMITPNCHTGKTILPLFYPSAQKGSTILKLQIWSIQS